MKIIHLISDISRVNFGIWNAALNTASLLNRAYGVFSEAWFPENEEKNPLDGYDVFAVPLKTNQWAQPLELIKERRLSTDETIVHSHGSWMSPTILGFKLRQLGYKWIYSPHGMLEPWSRQQKKFKKELYFRLFEKKYALKSDVIRAVGSPEKANLEKLFPNNEIVLIPNGIDTNRTPTLTPKPTLTSLFLSRLHHKKGVVPLVKAWISSSLYRDSRYRLVIAGPDDGEKEKMMNIINRLPAGTNIEYAGAVYDMEKEKLLRESTYFILPSFSEGFPTSIIEAMSYGCIPIISEGCNFPEAFAEGLAIKTSPHVEAIVGALEQIRLMSPQIIHEMSYKSKEFVNGNYSLNRIAQLQYGLYERLLV